MPSKRMLLWDWTNTATCPQRLHEIPFPRTLISSVMNWNAWSPPELHSRAAFRPMVHDMTKLSGEDWDRINAAANRDTSILFLNEPDRNGISAAQAAGAWMSHMVPLRARTGVKLISPACAGNDDGFRWTKDWMKIVESQGQPPDRVACHYYGEDQGPAIMYLEKVHAAFPDKELIVSEIGCIARNEGQVRKFTADLANWMDNQPWVSEYGFFGCLRHPPNSFVSPAAQLMNADGSFKDLMYKFLWDQPIRV